MSFSSPNTEKVTTALANGAALPRADYMIGRLGARPSEVSVPKAPLGEQRLGLRKGRDGLVYVPFGYKADRPAPLIVLLHGAGGNAPNTLGLLRPFADDTGAILVVPESRGATWDMILDTYGPDAEFIDRALAFVFSRYSVDPARVAISGFSDGASYALSLGIANGDLFRHILAFSPGFAAPVATNGAPRIFISHGDDDAVLSIDRCSRRIVPKLERAGYAVRYREFDGGHTVPHDIAREAVDWFTATK